MVAPNDPVAMAQQMLAISDRLIGPQSDTSRWIRRSLLDGSDPQEIAAKLVNILKTIKRDKGETP